MRFDKTTTSATRKKIQLALAALSEQLGVKITVGRATLARDGSNCTFKLECAAVDGDGVAQTKEVRAFCGMAKLYGLSKDDLGKIFTNGGETFTVSGLSPQARRFPILATRMRDGLVFKFSAEFIKLAIVKD